VLVLTETTVSVDNKSTRGDSNAETVIKIAKQAGRLSKLGGNIVDTGRRFSFTCRTILLITEGLRYT
jgi:hypothetical protein